MGDVFAYLSLLFVPYHYWKVRSSPLSQEGHQVLSLAGRDLEYPPPVQWNAIRSQDYPKD